MRRRTHDWAVLAELRFAAWARCALTRVKLQDVDALQTDLQRFKVLMTGVRKDRPLAVLTSEELAFYQEHGFVRVKEAFPTIVALELAETIWDELEREYGIQRDNRATWRQPSRAPKWAKESSVNAKMACPRFLGVISDLLGRNDWRRPRDWGGFLVTFPEHPPRPWDVPADTWHWDGGPEMAGPFIFSFYSEVRPGGGGTLILRGSHRLLRQFYESLAPEERQLPHKEHRRMFSAWDPWLADLTGRSSGPSPDRIAAFMSKETNVYGVRVQVMELCGDPGDAVFCAPMMLHAISANCSDRPRFMRSKFFYS